MGDRQFMLCDKYFVEETDKKGKAKRLVAVYSWNEYGSQGKDKYSFHVEGQNGIEVISGAKAKLMPLSWYQKDTYKAGVLGGIIGFLASLALMLIKNQYFPG